MNKCIKITAAVCAALGGAYCAGGFLGVPYLLDKALREDVSQLLNRNVSARKIAYNPFTHRLVIESFDISDAQQHSLLSVETLDVALRYRSILELSPIVEYLRVEKPQLNMVRTKFDRFNFSDIVDKLNTPPSEPSKAETKKSETASDSPFFFTVENISLKDGTIILDDKTRGRTDRVTEIAFDLPIVSNFTHHTANPIEPKLAFRFNGKPISTTANSLVFTDSLKTGVAISIRDISIPELVSFSPEPLNVSVDSGLFDATLNITYAKDEKAEHLLTLTGSTDIRKLSLSDATDPKKPVPLASLERLHVELPEISLQKMHAAVGQVTLDSPVVNVVRSASGINLAQLAAHPFRNPNAFGANKPAEPSKGPAWGWKVGAINLNNGTVNITDSTVGVQNKIDKLSVSVTGLSSDPKANCTVKASLVPFTGTLTAEGTLALDASSADLSLALSNFSIPAVNPYIKDASGVTIRDGSVGFAGAVKFRAPQDAAVTGTFSVDKFSINGNNNREFASFERFVAEKIDLHSGKDLSLAIANVALSQPRLSLMLDAKGNINAPGAAPSGKPEAKKEQQKTVQSKAPAGHPLGDLPDVRIASASITNGLFSIQDASVKPAYRGLLKNFSAKLSNLSTRSTEPQKFDVSTLFDSTPLKVAGSVFFKNGINADVKANFENLSLTPFSPYAAKFTGHPLKQGLMGLNGTYSLRGDAVDSKTNINVLRLEFHDALPEAKDPLPVGLAVALLQDRQGKIDLEIPATGSTSDPEFSVVGIVGTVISNLVTKAVTAPFSLIASAFGNDSLDLNHLAFEPGSSTITPATAKSVEIVAKTLAERPGLRLKVTGAATQESDADGLRKAMLEMDLRKIARNGNKPLSDKDRARALSELFAATASNGKPAAKTAQEQEAFLLTTYKTGESEIQALADRRARAVKEALTGRGVDAARILIVNEKSEGASGVKLDLDA